MNAESRIGDLAEEIVSRLAVSDSSLSIPVGISNRHIHLSQRDLETLFGHGYALTPQKELSQPGQYAAKETVCIAGQKGSFSKVRVLGPIRAESQVEISRTDAYQLGIDPPVRQSGDLSGAESVSAIGPCGMVILQNKVIIARRHIHMSVLDGKLYGVDDGDLVDVRNTGSQRCMFYDVVIRIHADFSLEFHVDTDEANAGGIKTGTMAQIIGKHKG